jgi:hypothetical protein
MFPPFVAQAFACGSTHDITTIHIQRLGRDVGRLCAGKENGGTGDLVRMPHAAKRHRMAYRYFLFPRLQPFIARE